MPDEKQSTLIPDRLNTRQKLGLILAIASIVISQVLPETSQLSVAGMKTVGLLIAYLIMLITEALPIIIIGLLSCALMPLLGITPNLPRALVGFSEPIVFFVLASFGLAMALTRIPLSQRILRALLRKFGMNIESVLLSMMICCALVSSIVSNVPTCMIFMTISLDFIKLYQDEEKRRISARTFMIAMPVASMIGGMITPAGSSNNILTMGLIEQHTGKAITFLQWMFAGIPLTIVMIPLAWFVLLKTQKPAQISETDIARFIDSMDIPEKIETKEKKVIVITIIMFTLWILSSWIPAINTVIVAVLGACVFMLPGMRIIKLETFIKENSWDAFFLMASVLSISRAMIDNGVSALIAQSIPALNMPLFLLIAFSAILIFVSLLIIPVAPSLLPIMAMPLASIAVATGASPVLVLLTAGLCGANCYLLPLDTVPIITYSKGYYSMTDMAKSTIFLQLAMIVFVMLWLPLVGMVFKM